MTTEESIAFVQARVTGNNNNITEYQSDNNSCAVMLSILQGTLNNPSADLIAANAEITTLEGTITDLQAQIVALTNPPAES